MAGSNLRTRSASKTSSGPATATMTSTPTSATTGTVTTAHTLLQNPQNSEDSNGKVFTLRPSKGTHQDGTDIVTDALLQDVDSADEATLSDGSDACQSPICHWDEVPAWLQDNPAIWNGYRRPTFSYKKCLASLGFLHNESVNIWTHLLGALACIVGAPIIYFKMFDVLDTIRWTDVVVFYAFLAGAIMCLGMSALFHAFSCHSEPVCHQWNRCDYVGIVFLIAGSFYPAIFYGFYCFRIWQITYIAMITLFGAATVVTVIKPKFRTPQYRWVRSSMFLAMGLSAVFPVIHGLVLYGVSL
ncbi:MAG: hemolysin-III related-domain-containing protein [Benniella sp.]|nr:MAG: hemolysin-III related-domain-containing protein [Benniella sp.]